VLVRQGELRRAVRSADAASARARATLDTASERLAAARHLRQECEAQVQRAREERADAVATWGGALRELVLDPGQVAALQDAAGAAGDLQPLLAPAAGLVRARLAGERASLEGSLAAHEAERVALEDEARRLEDDHDEPPGAPPWARSPRLGRPGAPLWQAVDLRPEVGASERASIEAALHAAGLLDAWLTPDGTLLDPGTLDTLLRPSAPAAQGPTLATVLSADPDGALDAALIDAALATVAYGPTAAGTGASAAIGADGSFVLGPVHGRAAKDQAEHLGAVARAARRARRLAEVRDALDAVAAGQAGIDASLARLAARSAALDADLAAFPWAAALDAALRSLGVAVAVEGRATTEHEQAEAEATRHAGVLLAAQADQREHAVAHGLSPELDDDALVIRRESSTRSRSPVRRWPASASARPCSRTGPASASVTRSPPRSRRRAWAPSTLRARLRSARRERRFGGATRR